MSASDHLTLECERNTKSLVEKFLNMQSEKKGIHSQSIVIGLFHFPGH